jgi:hypothetical protein
LQFSLFHKICLLTAEIPFFIFSANVTGLFMFFCFVRFLDQLGIEAVNGGGIWCAVV